jgi:pimeloyl-ACP methyl ester carboxylesterase
MSRMSVFLCLLLGAPAQDGLKLEEEAEAFGGRRTPLTFDGRAAFLLEPKGDAPAAPREWIWYAPTFKNQYPNARHRFLIERALKAGMAVAGIDVGESYGNPEGTRLYEGFHDAVVAKFKLSPRAVLLPQSRGGLMLYNWAALHPDQVRRIAGIYTVCDLRSWPGLGKAAPAYQLSEERLASELPSHNPIDLLAPLAKAKVPILHLHGDKDAVVPLEKNSGELARRYAALGGKMELVVVPGKGHEEVDEFFASERFATFLTTGK